MSNEITAEEKRRLMRERRQAKMAKGKASERLNSILSQGSSVKPSAVSVMDKPKQQKVNSTENAETMHALDAAEDPEVPEIQDFVDESRRQEPSVDDIFKQVFGSDVANGNSNSPFGASNQDFTQVMQKMMQGAGGSNDASFGAETTPEDLEYFQALKRFKAYEHSTWKFRFLIIRFVTILANFFYHLRTSSGGEFMSSPYSYIRGFSHDQNSSFFITFFTVEVLILTSYYLISSLKNLFETASENNMIMKLYNWGSLVIPQLQQYKMFLIHLVRYQELTEMFLGDLSIVVVLFGALSYFSTF